MDGKLLPGVTVLAAVVEARSFVRAAEKLDMTASGVSRAISRLEARIGVRLLDRSTRALTLTDEGCRLYEGITPLLDEIEHIATGVSGAAAQVRGRLRIDLDPFFSRLFLSRHLADLLARYPNLVLDLTTRETSDDLVKDGIDLAIRFGEPGRHSPVARKLIETRVLTVASPGYLARHGRPPTPQALCDHRCILFRNPANGKPFDWEFHRGKARLTVPVGGPIVLADVPTMVDACVAGAGIAQVLALDIRERLESGALVDLFPDWPDERFPLYALYPRRQHTPAKTKAFLDFVVERIAQYEQDPF